MNFAEYQENARKTAIYPGSGSKGDVLRDQKAGITYCALGVAGEAGEVAENAKKMLRDDNGVLTPSRRLQIQKELGDVLWYAANLARECDLELEQIAILNIKKLEDRQRRNVLQGSGDDR